MSPVNAATRIVLMHPNAQLIRDYLAYAGRSMDGIEQGAAPEARSQYQFYADNIITHFAGRSAVAGTCDGEAYARKFAAVATHLKMKLVGVVDVLASDTRALAIIKESMETPGGSSIVYDRVVVFRIENGRITEMSLRDHDQHLVDAFLMGGEEE